MAGTERPLPCSESQFPEKIPESWLAGFVHHHTAFSFPGKMRISPEELQSEVAALGGDFVFCAGDHGFVTDTFCNMGWYEGRNYYDYVLSANRGDGVFLIPTGEYHLQFPDEIIRGGPQAPFWEARKKWPEYKPFHHTFIPMLKWNDEICRYVREKTSPEILKTADKSGIAIPLLHPGLCHLTGHPDPLDIPWLEGMAYIEMFNEMQHFKYDFLLYKYYLSGERSRRMGIFSGVDFTKEGYTFSTPENTKRENVTYFHVPGGRSIENLFKAWNERRAVAVRGRLFLEHIEPIPCVIDYETEGNPEIRFTVRSFGEKKIQNLEILRNGRRVFGEYHPGRDAVEMAWSDETFNGKDASYTLIVEAEGDWLITSPISFRAG